MAKEQLYGIKYPFSNESWRGSYVDLNESEADRVKSEILHIIFTPKGQRLRMPEFGSDLIKYIFEPSDSDSWENMKDDIKEQINKYLPNVTFNNVEVYRDENNENSVVASVKYSVRNGKTTTENKVLVKVL